MEANDRPLALKTAHPRLCRAFGQANLARQIRDRDPPVARQHAQDFVVKTVKVQFFTLHRNTQNFDPFASHITLNQEIRP